ncbi:fungal-specific transcription factor domain-containing protein [Ilyonectria destructans]|nr:fungal-specific transcription factor domain-containing protein [Ilyonectria destructans]
MDQILGEPHHKAPRKRAAVACLACRTRKVRCDVALRGSPCTHCFLDSVSCGVKSRAKRQINKSARTQVITLPRNGDPPLQSLSSLTDMSASPQVNAAGSSAAIDIATAEKALAAESLSSIASAGEDQDSVCKSQGQEGKNATSSTISSPPSSKNAIFHTPTMSAKTTSAGVHYTHYRFLELGNLSKLSLKDIEHLESQFCLCVPTRGVLDSFMQQYFRYVHPFLPIIHEGDFWELYAGPSNSDSANPNDITLSLLLLQAMLFVSSNLVSLATLESFGFSSVRAARRDLYTRAKLLYDLGAEVSSYQISQAALLLSYWCPPADAMGCRPNYAWLTIAIQRAKDERAHEYSEPKECQHMTLAEAKRQNSIKRLWWCCIVRDRILSLGLRRNIYITHSDFDFTSKSPLSYADLVDEVPKSRVYDTKSKSSLMRLMDRVVQLCITLTDLLSAKARLEQINSLPEHSFSQDLQSTTKWEAKLSAWNDETGQQFPLTDLCASGGQHGHIPRHVILFGNTLYMYYFSAVMCLRHYQILCTEIAVPLGFAYLYLKTSYTAQRFHELQEATSSFTDCIISLMELQLTRWLPISSAAFTALPLILQTIKCHMYDYDANEFSDTYREGSIKRARLDALLDAMQIFTVQYDEAEWISAITRQAIQHARGLHDGIKYAKGECVKTLSTSPTIYLQSAVAVDWSLSRGMYTFHVKLLANLREWFHEDAESSRSQSDFNTNKTSPDCTNFMERNDEVYLQAQFADSASFSASYDASHVEGGENGNPGSIEAESLFDVMDLLEEPLDKGDAVHTIQPLGTVSASILEMPNISITDFVMWEAEMDSI